MAKCSRGSGTYGHHVLVGFKVGLIHIYFVSIYKNIKRGFSVSSVV